MNYLKAGDSAPSFELLDQSENTVSLDQALKQGKVLVYFYPKAMTPGCTTQAKALSEHLPAFSSHQVTIFGLSPDAPKRLAKFVERDALTITLLSDENHQIAQEFGVWGLKKFMGKEYDGIHRVSFLIDQDGKIEKVFNKFKTKDHHQVVLDYLDKS